MKLTAIKRILLGSTQIKINLNGSEVRPVYNDDKEIVLNEVE